MDYSLEDVMRLRNFTVVGNVLNKEKMAYEIYHKLKNANYNVDYVLQDGSLNDVNKIEVVVLCINSFFGLKILKENKQKITVVVIQPNAGSDEIIEYLVCNNIPYVNSCVLKGLELYR